MVDVIKTKQGQDVTWRSQVLKEDGSLITQADLLSITARVFRLGSATSTTAEQSIPIIIQDAVYDAAQTEGWNGADPGYNFKWVADGIYFLRGSARYRVEIEFSALSTSNVSLDTPIYDIFEVETEEVLSP